MSHIFSGSTIKERQDHLECVKQTGDFSALCQMREPPSLREIADIAEHYFCLNKNTSHSKAVWQAAELGERPHPNPYHNDHSHFRLASVLGIELLKTHNEIYQETDLELSPEDIAETLIAIFAHDIGHDGQTNTIDGVYVPYRLEEQSSQILAQEIDLPSEVQQRLRQMILGTDATFECPDTLPCNRIMQAYAHIINGNQQAPVALRNTPFEGLESDPKTLLKAALIHVADISATIALPPEMLLNQAQALAEERGNPAIASPEGNLNFIRGLGQNILIPEAGRKAFGHALKRNIDHLENLKNLDQTPDPQANQSA